jgi:hypothetical protein
MKPPPATPQKPKLLDLVRTATQLRHMSPKTTKAYSQWITHFIHYHKLKHPLLMGPTEINDFLTFIATELQGSGSA